ncbi:zinc metalloprotease HtpX [Aquibacillus saliphilus]|uniref:zinc metalloprotease HtpX n=1 Tax=Aquibacillus saliphilus TaxID=1909422 RepID=UPI001CF0CFA6
MLYKQIDSNKRKTVVIVLVFFLFILAIGALFGYTFYGSVLSGVIVSGVIALVYILIMTMNSSKIVMKMNHAKEVRTRDENTEVWDAVENMAMVANIPMPKVYIVEDMSPNAFATGNSPKKGAVAVTRGLVNELDKYELEGVIAHEVAHIRNYDIRLSTIAIALVAVVGILGDIAMRSMFFGRSRRSNNNGGGQIILIVVSLLLVIIAPIVATIIQLALSRNREYLADASAVNLTRNPDALVGALEKISGTTKSVEEASQTTASIYFINPFRKKKKRSKLFATHPPMEKRIERIKQM